MPLTPGPGAFGIDEVRVLHDKLDEAIARHPGVAPGMAFVLRGLLGEVFPDEQAVIDCYEDEAAELIARVNADPRAVAVALGASLAPPAPAAAAVAADPRPVANITWPCPLCAESIAYEVPHGTDLAAARCERCSVDVMVCGEEPVGVVAVCPHCASTMLLRRRSLSTVAAGTCMQCDRVVMTNAVPSPPTTLPHED